MKSKTLVVGLFFILNTFSQQSNKFLDRKFWKNKPTIEQIEKFIKKGNSITEKNKHSMNGICYAILEETDFPTLKKIIHKNIDINQLTHDKRTYIFWAAYKNNLELVDFLFKRGAKKNIIDSAGYSLLQFTAYTGNDNPNMYDLFIKNGIDLKELDKKGRNIALLHAHKMKEDLKFLKYLQNKGIDINAVDKNNLNIFTYACKTKNKKVLEVLIKKGISYKTNPKQKENAYTMATKYLHRSSAKVSLELLSYLENLGFDPCFIDSKGNSALHNIAFSSKNPTIFSYFIGKNLKTDLKNNKGNTAFANAAYANSKEVLALLKDKLKNINTKNKKGETPLTMAIRRNKPEIVSYLIKIGADVKVKDNKLNDLFYHLVKNYNSKELIDFNEKCNILEKNKLKIKNSVGLLHLAIKKNKVYLIDEILSRKIDVNAKNTFGYTALHASLMCGKDTKIIKKLLNVGARKTKTPLGETVYDLATENELLNKNEIGFLK